MQLNSKIQAFTQANHLLMTDRLVTYSYILRQYPQAVPEVVLKLSAAVDELNSSQDYQAFEDSIKQFGAFELFNCICKDVLDHIEEHGGCITYYPPKLINSVLLVEHNNNRNYVPTFLEELKYGS